jgi:hypothetical protein
MNILLTRPPAGVSNAGFGIAKLGVFVSRRFHKIEGFGAELQLAAFGYAKFFENRKVERPKPSFAGECANRSPGGRRLRASAKSIAGMLRSKSLDEPPLP